MPYTFPTLTLIQNKHPIYFPPNIFIPTHPDAPGPIRRRVQERALYACLFFFRGNIGLQFDFNRQCLPYQRSVRNTIFFLFCSSPHACLLRAVTGIGVQGLGYTFSFFPFFACLPSAQINTKSKHQSVCKLDFPTEICTLNPKMHPKPEPQICSVRGS